MQPKNKSERTRAFINFLLLFMLSVAIIITTVFFSVEVPAKQAKELRRQMHMVENEQEKMDKFVTKMSEIGGMLDSINTSRDPEYLDPKIKESIDNMRLRADNDSLSPNRVLYLNAAKNMYDLYIAKKQLRESTSKEDKVKELEKENADLQQKLDDRTKDYNTLLLQSSQRR